jgi:hypothetical protein
MKSNIIQFINMKKVIFGLIATVMFINHTLAQFDGTPTVRVIKFENLFDLPIGSKVVFDKANNTFNFTLNEDYLISGLDANGTLKVALSGSITCKCTKGSGCNPFIANGGDIVGCTVTACSACSMTTKVMSSGSEFELRRVTIVDKSEKIHFITEKEELLSSKCPESTMLNDKWFENEIVSFTKAYQKNNLDKVKLASTNEELKAIGYLYMPVNVYGYVYYLPVEKDLIISSNVDLNSALKYMMDGGKTSCKCNAGSGCTKKSKDVLIGSAVWCEAGNCTSCSLSY